MYDYLPAGVTAFWLEPRLLQEQFAGPIDLTENFELPGETIEFDWTIDFLAQGASTGFDLFVLLDTNAPYENGDQYCNEGFVTADGDTTAPVPEMDDACLVLTGSCVKNCEGTVYATGFEWNPVDDDTLQVTARCVAEATCGDSDERDAQPAELTR